MRTPIPNIKIMPGILNTSQSFLNQSFIVTALIRRAMIGVIKQ